MLLRDLLAGETENWTFVVWGSWNKPICVLGCYTFYTCIAYRRRLLKFVGSNLKISRQLKFFFGVHCYLC